MSAKKKKGGKGGDNHQYQSGFDKIFTQGPGPSSPSNLHSKSAIVDSDLVLQSPAFNWLSSPFSNVEAISPMSSSSSAFSLNMSNIQFTGLNNKKPEDFSATSFSPSIFAQSGNNIGHISSSSNNSQSINDSNINSYNYSNSNSISDSMSDKIAPNSGYMDHFDEVVNSNSSEVKGLPTMRIPSSPAKRKMSSLSAANSDGVSSPNPFSIFNIEIDNEKLFGDRPFEPQLSHSNSAVPATENLGDSLQSFVDTLASLAPSSNQPTDDRPILYNRYYQQPNNSAFSSPSVLIERFNKVNTYSSTSSHSSNESHTTNESHESISSSPQPGSGGASAIRCNCKKSKCLKLYCDCFNALRFCSGCNCMGCSNRLETVDQRDEAVRMIRERKPGAFQSKIVVKFHATGCNCKQSKCLKKYCECFQGNAFCGANCKCKVCSNFEGSEELMVVRTALVNMGNSNLSSLQIFRNDKPNRSLLDGGSSSSTQNPSNLFGYAGSSSSESNFSAPLPLNDHISSQSSLQSSSLTSPDTPVSIKSPSSNQVVKKRRKVATPIIEYAFFGPTLPKLPKVILLRCFEFLDNKCLYSASLVNSMWNKAAMDDALWE